MVEEDAYGRLYQLMQDAGAARRDEQTLRFFRGTVLETCPLKMEVAGTTQEAGRFILPRRLVVWREDKKDWESLLSVGSMVLLLSENDQLFYVLDEGVSL